jgi:hypothetical protein
VALGAEDVETAEVLDLVVLGRDRLLDPVEGRPVLVGVLLGGEAAPVELGERHRLGVAAEHDVGAAACHVGGDGDRAPAAGLRHDLRLALVVLRVEDFVAYPPLLQPGGEGLRLLDGGGADEDRLALLVLLCDVVEDRRVLGLHGPVDLVGVVLAGVRLVGGDRHHMQLVDLVELGGLRHGGAGHPAELLVEAEEVLEGDRGEGLVLVLDRHRLLGLDGLVQALVVAAAGEDAAGVLVDDEDLAVHDDVVLVLLEVLLGLERVVQVPDEGRVVGLVEALDAELVLEELHSAVQDRDRALLRVVLVVVGGPQFGEALLVQRRGEVLVLDGDAPHPRDHPGERLVPVRGLVGGAGDDQRGAGLVDEDRVGLVDDREVVAALHEFVLRPGHVVAQVVEAELRVGAVRDVAGVLRAPLDRGRLGLDDAHGQTQEAVGAAHPVGVALGEVVVDRDEVNSLAGKGVQVDGQGGDQGLALAGLHLGYVAEVEGRAAHDLYVEVAHPQCAAGGLAHGGEGLRQQVVEALTGLVPLLELRCERLEFLVGELLEVLLQGAHLFGDALEFAQDSSLAGPHDPAGDVVETESRHWNYPPLNRVHQHLYSAIGALRNVDASLVRFDHLAQYGVLRVPHRTAEKLLDHGPFARSPRVEQCVDVPEVDPPDGQRVE